MAELPELHAAMLAEQTRFDETKAAFQNTVRAWQGKRADVDVSRMEANEARRRGRDLHQEATRAQAA